MRRTSMRIASLLLIAALSGCWSEDRLTGTPKDLPPGFMPPAPPLTQSPADLAKARKGGKKAAPKASSPAADPATPPGG